MSISETHRGWSTKSHLNVFDRWNKMGNSEFLFKYGSFKEQSFFKKTIQTNKSPTILDFGCATGTAKRFLKLSFKENQYQYKGVDISSPVIERAKKLYSESEFELIDKNSNFLKSNKFDIVYSRDTVLHQEKPYDFIDSLLNSAKKSLILRLRTRDIGATIFDKNLSCQMHYDNYWMPYIVLNIDELINFFFEKKRVKSIIINKSYEVLGGHNQRYLPKDLYFKKSGCAETSILIHLGKDKDCNNKKIIIDSDLEGNMLLRKKRFISLFYRIISKFGL